ncbi:hypothetical protein CHLRE_12g494650v5 [Chlamydomonas reinhardtii]|uniref:Uncharacterized protein n=1 Tax=Chlamydomonas reinhardtii TaxID=3055 RepID=A0A2K3D1S1_CHLRE|nr:uncharacterized protein CHLRE_12g494650v5 [Chlamydomonas reinhardtii]PNW74481.1 hypothetical protein CHLRE_12g494650v5 [Chlamydomonas reinhardtii]
MDGLLSAGLRRGLGVALIALAAAIPAQALASEAADDAGHADFSHLHVFPSAAAPCVSYITSGENPLLSPSGAVVGHLSLYAQHSPSPGEPASPLYSPYSATSADTRLVLDIALKRPGARPAAGSRGGSAGAAATAARASAAAASTGSNAAPAATATAADTAATPMPSAAPPAPAPPAPGPSGYYFAANAAAGHNVRVWISRSPPHGCPPSAALQPPGEPIRMSANCAGRSDTLRVEVPQEAFNCSRGSAGGDAGLSELHTVFFVTLQLDLAAEPCSRPVASAFAGPRHDVVTAVSSCTYVTVTATCKPPTCDPPPPPLVPRHLLAGPAATARNAVLHYYAPEPPPSRPVPPPPAAAPAVAGGKAGAATGAVGGLVKAREQPQPQQGVEAAKERQAEVQLQGQSHARQPSPDQVQSQEQTDDWVLLDPAVGAVVEGDGLSAEPAGPTATAGAAAVAAALHAAGGAATQAPEQQGPAAAAAVPVTGPAEDKGAKAAEEAIAQWDEVDWGDAEDWAAAARLVGRHDGTLDRGAAAAAAAAAAAGIHDLESWRKRPIVLHEDDYADEAWQAWMADQQYDYDGYNGYDDAGGYAQDSWQDEKVDEQQSEEPGAEAGQQAGEGEEEESRADAAHRAWTRVQETVWSPGGLARLLFGRLLAAMLGDEQIQAVLAEMEAEGEEGVGLWHWRVSFVARQQAVAALRAVPGWRLAAGAAATAVAAVVLGQALGALLKARSTRREAAREATRRQRRFQMRHGHGHQHQHQGHAPVHGRDRHGRGSSGYGEDSDGDANGWEEREEDARQGLDRRNLAAAAEQFAHWQQYQHQWRQDQPAADWIPHFHQHHQPHHHVAANHAPPMEEPEQQDADGRFVLPLSCLGRIRTQTSDLVDAEAGSRHSTIRGSGDGAAGAAAAGRSSARDARAAARQGPQGAGGWAVGERVGGPVGDPVSGRGGGGGGPRLGLGGQGLVYADTPIAGRGREAGLGLAGGPGGGGRGRGDGGAADADVIGDGDVKGGQGPMHGGGGGGYGNVIVFYPLVGPHLTGEDRTDDERDGDSSGDGTSGSGSQGSSNGGGGGAVGLRRPPPHRSLMARSRLGRLAATASAAAALAAAEHGVTASAPGTPQVLRRRQ